MCQQYNDSEVGSWQEYLRWKVILVSFFVGKFLFVKAQRYSCRSYPHDSGGMGYHFQHRRIELCAGYIADKRGLPVFWGVCLSGTGFFGWRCDLGHGLALRLIP